MICVDCNVLVSALISPVVDTPPRRVIEAVARGDVRVVVTPALYAEYEDVSTRPKIRRRIKEGPERATRLLTLLAEIATWVATSPSDLVCPDPRDQHLWDLLDTEPAAVLITGERALVEGASGPLEGRVMTAADWLASLSQASVTLRLVGVASEPLKVGIDLYLHRAFSLSLRDAIEATEGLLAGRPRELVAPAYTVEAHLHALRALGAVVEVLEETASNPG